MAAPIAREFISYPWTLGVNFEPLVFSNLYLFSIFHGKLTIYFLTSVDIRAKYWHTGNWYISDRKQNGYVTRQFLFRNTLAHILSAALCKCLSKFVLDCWNGCIFCVSVRGSAGIWMVSGPPKIGTPCPFTGYVIKWASIAHLKQS